MLFNALLISAFVFAEVKIRFSRDTAHMINGNFSCSKNVFVVNVED